jgi:hypothetical protein
MASNIFSHTRGTAKKTWGRTSLSGGREDGREEELSVHGLASSSSLPPSHSLPPSFLPSLPT